MELLDRDYHRTAIFKRSIEGSQVLHSHEIVPQERIRLTCRFSAPSQSGVYNVEVDCVSEGVCWFKDIGSPTVFILLTVE